MISSTRSFFRQRWQLHEGEGRKLFPLLLLMFLTLTILLLLKPTSTGIFVAELGAESLSKGFIAVAIAAVVVTILLTNFTTRLATTVLLRFTYLFTAILVGFLIYFRQQFQLSTVGLYTLYIWGNLFGVVAVSQVYLLAGELFDIQTARRFFVWLGIAAISGGVFGGYLASFLATLVDADAVLAGVLLCCLICIVLCYILPSVDPNLHNKQEQEDDFLHLMLTPFRYFQQSRYLQLVAGMVALGVIVAKLVEYQFSILAVNQFQDKDSLTAFFGFWISTISIISLAIQLLLTDRIIDRMGITNSLKLLPRGLFLATFAILFSPALWAVVFARVVDGGIKQSVHKSAFELSLLPLSSNEKKMSKTFIDIFVDSAATGLSGLLLAVLIYFDHIPIRLVALVTIIFLVAWIYVVTRFSEAYVEIFRQRIEQKAGSMDGLPAKQPLVSLLKQTVQQGHTKQVRRLLQRIKDGPPRAVFITPLRKLLKHPSPQIRKLAINCLQHYQQIDLSTEMKAMLQNESSAEVKMQALYYLTMRQSRHELEEIVALLDSEDQKMAHAALFTLLAETRTNPHLWEKLDMQQRLEQLLSITAETPPGMLRATRRQLAAQAIVQARKKHYYQLLLEWLPSSSPSTRRQLFVAMRQLRHPVFLIFLWEMLQSRHRQEAIRTLGVYPVNTILAFLREQNLANNLTLLRIAPRIFRHLLPAPKALQQLYKWLEHPDPILREECLMALRQYQLVHTEMKFSHSRLRARIIAEEEEYWTFTQIIESQEKELISHITDGNAQRILLKLLKKRRQQVFKRIFRLLTLYYNSKDFANLYRNFRLENEDKYPISISFLETLISRRMRKGVMPILNHRLYGEKPEELASISLDSAYRLLIKLDDSRIKLSLLEVLVHWPQEKRADLMNMLRKSNYQLVRQRVEVLEQRKEV